MLLIVVPSLISSGGGSDGGDTGAVGAGGYEATFSSICGRSAAAMGLEMAINAPFSQGDLPAGVSLNGDAWQDPDFGVMVDGEGDSICLGDTSAEGWSGDDDFTISFSFTKQACRIPGDYEFLFSTFGDCTSDWNDQTKPRCSITRGEAAGIHIFLVRKSTWRSAAPARPEMPVLSRRAAAARAATTTGRLPRPRSTPPTAATPSSAS